MDEEGFYVGERPKVIQSHMRTMKNRILQRKVIVTYILSQFSYGGPLGHSPRHLEDQMT